MAPVVVQDRSRPMFDMSGRALLVICSVGYYPQQFNFAPSPAYAYFRTFVYLECALKFSLLRDLNRLKCLFRVLEALDTTVFPKVATAFFPNLVNAITCSPFPITGLASRRA